MDFLKLNNEFLALQERLDKYALQEKKLKEILRKLEKQIAKLEEKKIKEKQETDKIFIDLNIALKKEILLLFNDLV